MYKNETAAGKHDYAVKLRDKKARTGLMEVAGKVEYKYVAKKNRELNVIIYKVL